MKLFAHLSFFLHIFAIFILNLLNPSPRFPYLFVFQIIVPTGLLALQGVDVPGRLIRNKMNQLNISKDFIQGKFIFLSICLFIHCMFLFLRRLFIIAKIKDWSVYV